MITQKLSKKEMNSIVGGTVWRCVSNSGSGLANKTRILLCDVIVLNKI